jgi:hypothetical protein
MVLDMFYHTRTAKLGAKYFSRREIDLDTASDTNFKRAKQCLYECISFHHLCIAPSVQRLPTRLIEVGDISLQAPFLFIPTTGNYGDYARSKSEGQDTRNTIVSFTQDGSRCNNNNEETWVEMSLGGCALH